MLRKKQSSILVNGKTVYKAETPHGWAIVIMPDNILIDNYHIDKAHIHPNPKKHIIKEEIGEDNPKKVYETVLKHLYENDDLNLDKLKKELKQ